MRKHSGRITRGLATVEAMFLQPSSRAGPERGVNDDNSKPDKRCGCRDTTYLRGRCVRSNRSARPFAIQQLRQDTQNPLDSVSVTSLVRDVSNASNPVSASI